MGSPGGCDDLPHEFAKTIHWAVRCPKAQRKFERMGLRRV